MIKQLKYLSKQKKSKQIRVGRNLRKKIDRNLLQTDKYLFKI